jgi:hypothetical protein
MNHKLLALFGLKWNPFCADVPVCRVPHSSVVVFSPSAVAVESGKGSVPDSAGYGGIRD